MKTSLTAHHKNFTWRFTDPDVPSTAVTKRSVLCVVSTLLLSVSLVAAGANSDESNTNDEHILTSGHGTFAVTSRSDEEDSLEANGLHSSISQIRSQGLVLAASDDLALKVNLADIPGPYSFEPMPAKEAMASPPAPTSGEMGNLITFSTIDAIGTRCVMVYGGPSLRSEKFLIQDCGESQWRSKWNYNNGYIRKMSFLDESQGWLVMGHSLVKVERVNDELQATVVRDDPSDGIESVFFLNELYGWTCGDKGSIHKTEDGGVTWRQQVTPTDIVLRQVRFMNALEGWASGAEYRRGRVESVILTTHDGGSTWVTLDMDAAKDLSPVFFLSPRHACGVDDNNSIVCTNDGENWSVRYSDTAARKSKTAIFFANEKRGWIAGDGIWHTSDGGQTWEQQFSLPKSDTFENVTFANDRLGWANTLQAVWRTKDGGKSWTKISDAWIFRLRGRGADRGVSHFKPNPLKTVAYGTKRGGRIWSPVDSEKLSAKQNSAKLDLDMRVSVQEGIYDSVPQHLRQDLIKGLNLLLNFRREERWDGLYELISEKGIRGRSREQFVADYSKYPGVASTDLKLVGFWAKVVTPDSFVPNGWIVAGCAQLTEVEFPVDAFIAASRENNKWHNLETPALMVAVP